MNILQDDNRVKGRFYVEISGNEVAEMTYTYAGPNKIIIDHTQVDETLKGQGVGYKLIEESVSFMRTNGLKVIPLCPFAKAAFQKKSNEYKDVIQ
jgi:predicted GNAT family acetyltransferase